MNSNEWYLVTSGHVYFYRIISNDRPSHYSYRTPTNHSIEFDETVYTTTNDAEHVITCVSAEQSVVSQGSRPQSGLAQDAFDAPGNFLNLNEFSMIY